MHSRQEKPQANLVGKITTQKEGEITFQVTDVKAEKFSGEHKDFDCTSLAPPQEKGEKPKAAEYLQGSIKKGVPGRNASFVSTAVSAYNQHYNLVIRPDDIWIAIMTQFSLFVNKFPEELRNKFVDFEGKKELTVVTGGSLHTVKYDQLALLMEEQIAKNIKDPSVRSWVVPGFSTTTSSDRAVGAVVLMAAMQKYFSYRMMLLCGLPNVTLLGKVADWEEVRKRAGRLAEFDVKGMMKEWSKMLLPVLDKFVETANGKIDAEWWNRIAHRVGGGSGPSYLSGWITVFCVFNNNGGWQGDKRDYREIKSEWPFIDTSDIPKGYVSVPVVVNDNGKEYKTTMYAGHIVAEYKDDAIIPQVDWVIMINKD